MSIRIGLAIWFVVSFGAGILFVDQLDHTGFLRHFKQVICTTANINRLHGLIIHHRIDGVAA